MNFGTPRGPARARALLLAVALALTGCGGGGGSPETDSREEPGGLAPQVSLTLSPRTGTAPLTVHFDGAASAGSAGGPLSFSWEFGDGQTSELAAGTVTYPVPGTYRVLLTVTDATGVPATGEATVVVGQGPGDETLAERVVYLTNLERRAQGLAPLKGESRLEEAAGAHAAEMANLDYFSHQSADGRSLGARLTAAGYAYSTAGENIAAGYPDPEAVVQGWMNSAGHRANILNAAFRELGVGYVWEAGDLFPGPSGYGHYWVQNLGARRDVYPLVIEDEAYRTGQRAVDLYLHGAGWAERMLLSEEPDFAGAAWQPFSPEVSWELSPTPGRKRVCVRLARGSAETLACDEIWLE